MTHNKENKPLSILWYNQGKRPPVTKLIFFFIRSDNKKAFTQGKCISGGFKQSIIELLKKLNRLEL